MNKERIEYLEDRIQSLKTNIKIAEARKYKSVYINEAKELLKFFEEWLGELKADEWVSVDDRLPSKFCKDGILYNIHPYLVTLKNNCVCEAFWSSERFQFLKSGLTLTKISLNNPVIAWKELPKPYVKGSNE